MKRRNLSDNEYDQVQRLRVENKRLKQALSQLRKQVSRVNVDRFQNLKDVIEKQEEQERKDVEVESEKQLKQDWKCFHCEDGILHLTVLERRDGVFYMRKCDKCRHRTRLQPYSDNVKGSK